MSCRGRNASPWTKEPAVFPMAHFIITFTHLRAVRGESDGEELPELLERERARRRAGLRSGDGEGSDMQRTNADGEGASSCTGTCFFVGCSHIIKHILTYIYIYIWFV